MNQNFKYSISTNFEGIDEFPNEAQSKNKLYSKIQTENDLVSIINIDLKYKNSIIEKKISIENMAKHQAKSDKHHIDFVLFFKYHFLALISYLAWFILYKILQNMIGRYCFSKGNCDCSDNDIAIKIWTMVILQANLGSFIIVNYLVIPELLKESKFGMILQFNINFYILLFIGVFVDGQTQLYAEFRIVATVINAFVYWGFVYRFLKNGIHFRKFFKTQIPILIVGMGFIFSITYFGQGMKNLLDKLGAINGLAVHTLCVVLIINSYKIWIFWIIPKVEIMKGDQSLLYDKHITIYEIFAIPLLAIKVGYMMQEIEINWNYYVYLVLFIFNSIELQTGVICISLKKLHHKIINTNNKHYTVYDRSFSTKLAGGRKFVFTVIIFIKLATYMVAGEWTEHYNDNTKGCKMEIPDACYVQLSWEKIIIFTGLDIFIDILCFLYNIWTNFKNITYHIPQRSYFLQGFVYFFSSYLFELLVQKVLSFY